MFTCSFTSQGFNQLNHIWISRISRISTWSGLNRLVFLVMTLCVNYNIFNRSFWKSYMLESRILTTLCLLQNHTHTHAHTIVLFSQTQKKPRTHPSHTNSPGMWARKTDFKTIFVTQTTFSFSSYWFGLFLIILY